MDRACQETCQGSGIAPDGELGDRVLERDVAELGEAVDPVIAEGNAEGNATLSEPVGVLTASTECCTTSWRQRCSSARGGSTGWFGTSMSALWTEIWQVQGHWSLMQTLCSGEPGAR